MTWNRLARGLVLALLFSATASAQTKTTEMWRRGTTLNVFTGAAAAPSDRAPLAGGAFGWEITPRIALEGSGTWMEWGHRAHGFSATIRALLPISTARPVIPFIAAGVGLHRASFQTADSQMPDFYRDRLAGSPERFGVSAAFTDPTVVLGGGVNGFISRHIAIRPDVNAIVVMRDGHSRTMMTTAVHLAYHFEDHPITP